MHTKLFALAITLLLCKLSGAQNRELDSLQRVVQHLPADTQKVNALNRLSRLLESRAPARSLQYAKEAHALATRINFKKGIAYSRVYEADNYYLQGKAHEGEKLYEEAINILDSIGDRKGLAWTYMVAGNNFTTDGRFEKAVEYALKSVKINEAAGNTSGYAWGLETVGNIFIQLGHYDKASEYLTKSLDIMTRISDLQGMASCYNSLGIIKDYSGAYAEALRYYEKALALHQKTGNLAEVLTTKMNIGVAYFYSGQYSQSIRELKESVRMGRQLNLSSSVASALINLGEAYMRVKNYTLSVASLKEGISLAGEIGALEYKREGVRILSEVYFAVGDYRNAWKQELLYTAIKDSILEESSNRQILEMNSKYESEKKDRELLQKDAELSRQAIANRQKAMQRNAFIGAFATMLACAFFIFRGYRQKKKMNVTIRRQKEVIEEKQKEILDSIYYARRIQRALITPEKYIERALNKRLQVDA